MPLLILISNTFMICCMLCALSLQTPVIRRKFPSMVTITTSFSDESATSTLSSDDSSLSTEPTDITNMTGASGIAAANQNVVPSAWRKPQLSQRRTRERLCNVLKGLGQKEVGFERSPSVSPQDHIVTLIIYLYNLYLSIVLYLCYSGDNLSKPLGLK